MSIEAGNKLKSKVTGIKKFGIFVELPEGENGLAHISGVADNHIEGVEEHLSVGDEVDIKVLSIADDGKVSPSIKKTGDRSREQHMNKPGRQKPVQKAEGFEEKLDNFLKDSEGKSTSVKHQTESRRGGKGSRH